MRCDERLAAPDDRGDDGLGGKVWRQLQVVELLRGGTWNGVIYVCIYICIYIHVCVYVCMYMYVYLGLASAQGGRATEGGHTERGHICVCLYIYIYMHVCVCMYECICMYM